MVGFTIVMNPLIRSSAFSKRRAIAWLVAVGLVSAPVSAQPGASTRIFEPTSPGDRFRLVPDAMVRGDGEPWVGWSWDYAYRPRSVFDEREEKGLWEGAEIFTLLGASYALWNRLAFDIAQPLRLASTAAMSKETGASLVDTRVGTRASIGPLTETDLLGGELSIWIPTGNEDKGTSDGSSRVHIRGIVSGRRDAVDYTASLGWLHRKKADVGNLTIGPAITFGAGASFGLVRDLVWLGPEIAGHFVLPGDGVDTGWSRSVPVEGSATTRVRVGRWLLGGLLGTGLTPTPGTARFRVELSVATVASITVGPSDWDGDGIEDGRDACPRTPGLANSDPRKHGCPFPDIIPSDRDGDGIADDRDACIETAGVSSDDPWKHGCPPDRDGDGIVDELDACPDTVGEPSEEPSKHGCPRDSDGDGIIDALDACVDVPGVASEDPGRHGCPADRDGDGIVDELDACPDTPGQAHEDKDKNGCPPVAIVADEIRITETIHFATRSARILPESDALLGQIAELLQDHPEILLVSIEGHTDSRDNAYFNQQLSTWRAASVQKWLVQRGKVAPARLTSVGYGKDRPIASNDTPEGMARNRRVEFHIKKRATVDEEPSPTIR